MKYIGPMKPVRFRTSCGSFTPKHADNGDKKHRSLTGNVDGRPPIIDDRGPSRPILGTLPTAFNTRIFMFVMCNLFLLYIFHGFSQLNEKSITEKNQVEAMDHLSIELHKTSVLTRLHQDDEPGPTFKLENNQTLCKLKGLEVTCWTTIRNASVSANPRFANYVLHSNGTKWYRQSSQIFLPIATEWFRPNPDKYCGMSPQSNWSSCANLGDELGPLLLLKLSKDDVIEKRYDGMDVVVIGSVLNFIVSNYQKTVKRIGSHHNVTVWGTGTKWGVGGVCFDFRAVRGPKTRKVFMDVGCSVPEVYGDPALLLPYLYDPRKSITPEVDLCIIPHMDDLVYEFEWWEHNNGTSLKPRFSYLDHEVFNSTTGNSTEGSITWIRVIDIRTPNVANFVDTLSTCRLVASASLHGLILAEAYNIPWSWVQLKEKNEGAFKYHDFFLSIGVHPDNAKPLRVTAATAIGEILFQTKKPKARGASLYDPKKLLDACPFCDRNIVESIKSTIDG